MRRKRTREREEEKEREQEREREKEKGKEKDEVEGKKEEESSSCSPSPFSISIVYRKVARAAVSACVDSEVGDGVAGAEQGRERHGSCRVGVVGVAQRHGRRQEDVLEVVEREERPWKVRKGARTRIAVQRT